MADGPEKKTAFEQGWAEIRRAQSLNDSSGLQQTMQSFAARTPLGSILSGVPLTVGYSYQGTPEAQAKLKEAEAAFQSQNFQVAVKLYMEAAALDPAWYTPRLYAGDMYFRMRDWNNAAIWFQKAIDIDPDRDTAYRYWGDALFPASDANGAKQKYEQAVVAEPYSKPGWLKLGQWATMEQARIVRPLITIPEFTTLDGKLKVDPALTTETGDGHASWLVYQNTRVAHGAMTRTQFIVAGATDSNFILHPSGYYHSLAEEVESINAMLADLQKKLDAGTVTPDKLEPSLKNLLALQKSGMIECWILLNASDAGIRHDYPDYRKQHRDLLVKYIDCYNLAAGPPSTR
jgi:tetratricopeptide (TPR) repeat protein